MNIVVIYTVKVVYSIKVQSTREPLRSGENQECFNIIDDFGCTVEPRYLKLGYLKLSAITNSNHFPLDKPFQSFIIGHFKPPTILNYVLFPLRVRDMGV